MNEGRLPCLDGLRAVAIALVMTLHLAAAGLAPGSFALLFCGRMGVSLFFVVSGFLITSLLVRERELRGRVSLRRFYARRALRIFPPFYAYLLFLLVAPRFGLLSTSPRALLVSGCYLMNWFPGMREHNVAHTWSLSYEEQYYVVWPVVLLLLGWTRAFGLATLTALLWPLLHMLKRSGVAPPLEELLQSTGFETLLIGSALGLLPILRPETGTRWRSRTIAILAPVAGIVTLYAVSWYLPRPATVLVPLARDLLLAWIVWWCVHSPEHPAARLLESRPLVLVGTLSYSLYIWHLAFLRPKTSVCAALLEVALAATLSYMLLERPLSRARARLRPGNA